MVKRIEVDRSSRRGRMALGEIYENIREGRCWLGFLDVRDSISFFCVGE